jgi:hypothetical protein
MGTCTDVLDWVGSSVEIESITPDADRAEPGYQFIALPTTGEDGRGRVH